MRSRAFFLLLLPVSLVGAGQQAAQKTAATTVGSDTCQACHEEVSKAFQKNPHAAVDKDAKRGWQGKACEACHGPGILHAESTEKKDIRNPGKLAPAEVDRTCLTCHLNQPTHVGRIQGSHAKNQVSCTACHAIHKPAAGEMRPSAVNEKCARCHTQVWAQFQRPYKHKLPEGAMTCVDCHNPHGSFLPKSIQTVSANEPGCFKCHGDKRGPFAYEHAPVRLEGCMACHQPHGSANPRMLTRHEVRFVCLECHANLPLPSVQTSMGTVPPAFHDMRQARYQNCTICHVKIHGSNVDRDLTR